MSGQVVDAQPAATNLEDFGWSELVAAAFAAVAGPGHVPGRVVAEDRGSYQVVAGHRRAAGGRRRSLPATKPATIPLPTRRSATGSSLEGARRRRRRSRRSLPRRTSIVRHAPGKRTVAQVVAANVDVVFVVASLNQDLNLRRLERYLAVAWESGAQPVVVLSKADLADDLDGARRRGRRGRGRRAGRDDVSAVDGRGHRRGPGADRAGRDRRVHRLVGRRQVDARSTRSPATSWPRVKDIREDDARGRHTTTRRQLHLLPDGGLVLDTPGHARARAVGGRRRSRAVVRRHRGARRGLPVLGLRPRRRARLRGRARRSRTATSRRRGSTAGGSSSARRATSSAGSTRSPAPRSGADGKRSTSRSTSTWSSSTGGKDDDREHRVPHSPAGHSGPPVPALRRSRGLPRHGRRQHGLHDSTSASRRQ